MRASKIEISHKTIIFTILLLAGIWFLVQVQAILFLFFISFILMSALRPLVDGLERFRIPRVFGILLIYLIVFGFFGISLLGTIPSLVVQSTRLIHELPALVTRVLPYWNLDVRSLTQQLTPIGENIVRLSVGIFSNFITTLTVLVFTFYLLMERKHTELFLQNVFGEEKGATIIQILRAIEQRLGAWLYGQLSLMCIIGVMVYIGLTLLHVEFALPLAIIAGILEAVPMVGPIVSAVPAVLVGLTVSPFLALSVVALYFIVQQTENNLFVPFIMKKSVGLSPLVTIFSLLIGGKIAGIAGAILAVPVVLVLEVLIGRYKRAS